MVSDPFRLSAHLEDDHEYEAEFLELLDSDDLRTLHVRDHTRKYSILEHFHTVFERSEEDM